MLRFAVLMSLLFGAGLGRRQGVLATPFLGEEYQSHHQLVIDATSEEHPAIPAPAPLEDVRPGSSTWDRTRPFYLIAHQVLSAKHISTALSNGANALEIDATAHKGKGWWAQHDQIAEGRRDPMRDMFSEIVKQRGKGKTITFVWMDMKNPDECDWNKAEERNCSLRTVREMAQEMLAPVGVRVLWGFYGSTLGSGFDYLRREPWENEAINLDGNSSYVRHVFDRGGPDKKGKRVMSSGDVNLKTKFGDCRGNCNNTSRTCTQLKCGADAGRCGKVFGWTVSVGRIKTASFGQTLLLNTDVDGLIYGYGDAEYNSSWKLRDLAKILLKTALGSPTKRFLARQEDAPW